MERRKSRQGSDTNASASPLAPPPSHSSTPQGLADDCTVAIPRLVDPRTAARILGRSVNTLKRWRYEGIGPNYVVIEGRVSYDVAVLLECIRKNTRVPSVRARMEASRGAL